MKRSPAGALASRLAIALLCATGLCAMDPSAHAATGPAPRLALVIGNASYSVLPALPACTASSHVVAAALGRAGFGVTEKQDVTNGQMGAALADFAAAVARAPGARAVVYVCGYAVGFNNRAFLLPVSANMERDTDALTQGLVAKSVLDAIARAGAGAGLVLFDAVAKPASSGSLWFDTLAAAAPPRVVGFAAASSAVAPPQGATPLATAFSAALAPPEIEIGVLLDVLKQRLGGGPGPRLDVQAPAEPAWLVGGPTAALPATVPSPPAPLPQSTPSAATPPAATPPAPTPPVATPPVAVPVVPDEEHMTDADRQRIQAALLRLGYYAGKVDGLFGPDTRAAIRRFQHEIGADMTGRITPEQSGRLLVDSR